VGRGVGRSVGGGVGFGVGCLVGARVGRFVGLGVEQHSPRTLHEFEGILLGSSPLLKHAQHSTHCKRNDHRG
jgi:hypothetical protein